MHRPGDTFAIETLRSMIELKSKWTEDDLRRPALIAWATESAEEQRVVTA
jgi:hypothetical protein